MPWIDPLKWLQHKEKYKLYGQNSGIKYIYTIIDFYLHSCIFWIPIGGEIIPCLHETKRNQAALLSLKPFGDFKTWQPYPNVYNKLTSQNLTRCFKKSETES